MDGWINGSIPIEQYLNEELNKNKNDYFKPNISNKDKLRIAKSKLKKTKRGSVMERFWLNEIKELEK